MRNLFPLVVLLCSAVMAAEPARRPNILFILTDDQGYGDLSCTGNPILRTPNIDRFAAESVRLSNYHVSPTCSPTRSATMSGRHEFHNGVTHTIMERERMSLKTTTIAQVLKSAGYTTGIFGKWHLGDEDAYQPDKRGFDEVFIHGAGGIGQTYPGSCGDAPGNTYYNPAIKHNGKFERTQGYCTDVFFAQATTWMDEKRKGGQPFFCYLPTNVPHAPLSVPPGYENLYEGKAPENAAKFFDMIANIDDNVGKLMAKLRDWNIDNNTVVIWATDNGGTAGVRVYNAGMRGQKGTPYEGGTHVPAFFRWPGHFPAGTEVGKLTAHLDLFPTFAEIAGAKIPEDVAAKLEGRSLVPLLTGDPNAQWPDRYLFTHVGRWPKGKAAASKYLKCSVRNSRYALVSAAPGGEKAWELFDLKEDAGQTTNVADKHPEVVKELEAAYDKWWESILPDLVNEDAVGPKVNPFKEEYWKQFGGGPKPGDIVSDFPQEGGKGKKGKGKKKATE